VSSTICGGYFGDESAMSFPCFLSLPVAKVPSYPFSHAPYSNWKEPVADPETTQKGRGAKNSARYSKGTSARAKSIFLWVILGGTKELLKKFLGRAPGCSPGLGSATRRNC